MTQRCEAECGANATVEVPQHPHNTAPPFHLCAPCAERLQTRSLRPAEWYHLVVKHSFCTYWLHDDFYTDDGVADQPAEPVIDPELHPTPTLDDVRHDLSLLLDHCHTRFNLGEAEYRAFAAFDPRAVLAEIDRRLALPRGDLWELEYTDIALTVPCERTTAWYRGRLSAASGLGLQLLLHKGPCGIPWPEWYDLAARGAAADDPRQRSEWCRTLARARDPRFADWLEANIVSPTSGDWGDAAADAGVPWPRLREWLARGRPLSLVALDALVGRLCRPDHVKSAPADELRRPETAAEIRQALAQAAAADPAPRATESIARIFDALG